MNSGAAQALRSIDAERARANTIAGRKETEIRSPEMLAVAKHYYSMGESDRRAAARVDPRLHLFGCRCVLCDEREYTCPIETCARTLKGQVRLSAHLTHHKRAAAKGRITFARLVHRRRNPAGMDFLTALLGDEKKARTVDVRALRLFEEQLRLASGGRLQRRSAATKNALQNAIEHPKEVRPITATMTGELSAIVYRLALLASISPTAVTSALVTYGIEKFAEDMRRERGIARTPVGLKVSESPMTAEAAETIAPPVAYPDAEESDDVAYG